MYYLVNGITSEKLKINLFDLEGFKTSQKAAEFLNKYITEEKRIEYFICRNYKKI